MGAKRLKKCQPQRLGPQFLDLVSEHLLEERGIVLAAGIKCQPFALCISQRLVVSQQ